ncbi:mannosyl-oligosaccharide 1,2-alpha-mannosidase IA [Tachysurus ichikawai]
MAFRKLPGVSVSAMGLRLSQKFAFLLFLSGLVTLCLGALFFLPDSVRLKRFFLPKTESAPANTAATQSGAIVELAEKAHAERERQERERSAPFKPEPNGKLRVSRKPSVTRGDATGGTVERPLGAHEERRARTQRGDATEGTTAGRAKGCTYDTIRKCLLKPALGNDRGKPSDQQTVQRRDKVREVRDALLQKPSCGVTEVST